MGAVLALSVGLSATFIGLDRDRAFYPTVMMVTASYYALIAVMGGSIQVLMMESMAIVAFLGASGCDLTIRSGACVIDKLPAIRVSERGAQLSR